MMKKSGCKPLETELDNLKRLLEDGVGKSEASVRFQTQGANPGSNAVCTRRRRGYLV
jgi:hypothetical protein